MPHPLSTAVALVRGREWWSFKLAPIVAAFFTEVLLHGVPPGAAFLLLLRVLGTSASLAAFGHVVNDAADVADDLRAGKRNALAAWRPWQRWALAAVLYGLAFVPWVGAPLPAVALLVLVGEAVLLVGYSVRPVRWKERGAAGLVADALYAHVMPVLFVAAVVRGGALPSLEAGWTAAVAVWAFAFGLRGILVHQIGDEPADRLAGARTFVVAEGRARAEAVLHRVFLAEKAACVAAVGVLALFAPLAAALVGASVAGGLLLRRVPDYPHLRTDPAPHPSQPPPLFFLYSLDLPVFLGAGLLARDLAYAAAVAPLFAFVEPGLYRYRARFLVRQARAVQAWLRRLAYGTRDPA